MPRRLKVRGLLTSHTHWDRIQFEQQAMILVSIFYFFSWCLGISIAAGRFWLDCKHCKSYQKAPNFSMVFVYVYITLLTPDRPFQNGDFRPFSALLFRASRHSVTLASAAIWPAQKYVLLLARFVVQIFKHSFSSMDELLKSYYYWEILA